MGERFDARWCNLVTSTQIIQTEGSYSFPLCGMIIACLGFIFFIGLLLFHRMHRNYLTGIACPVFSFSILIAPPHPTESLSPSHQEHRESQPWWRNRPQSRVDLPEQKRQRAAVAESGDAGVQSLATVGYEIMTQSVSECWRCSNNSCPKDPFC